MKAQLRKPARERARYTEEYKKEALELWRNSGRSAEGRFTLARAPQRPLSRSFCPAVGDIAEWPMSPE
jgi:hypothetical protein